ncbi:MAG: dethiobiotin synthase [Deltaproteobacteria bacterium]
MSKGIFIIGTDTEVGKTVVSAGLMHLLLGNKHKAAYFKPVASGEVLLNGSSQSTDASFVKAVSGFAEDPKNMTPFSFKNAVAPHFAARLEGRSIDLAVIQNTLQYLKNSYEMIIAEGAGGLAVPLNDQGFMQYDLIRELGFPCLLVCRTGLGTINHTLLTLRFAKSAGLAIKGIVMNGDRQTEAETDNIETVKKLSGIAAIFTIPALTGLDTEKLQPGNIADVFEKAIDIKKIIGLMEGL